MGDRLLERLREVEHVQAARVAQRRGPADVVVRRAALVRPAWLADRGQTADGVFVVADSLRRTGHGRGVGDD